MVLATERQVGCRTRPGDGDRRGGGQQSYRPSLIHLDASVFFARPVAEARALRGSKMKRGVGPSQSHSEAS